MSSSLDDYTLRFGEPPSYTPNPDVTEEKGDARNARVVQTIRMDENFSLIRRYEGRIARPVCLPQLELGFDTPFARGYAPILAERGIPQETFLEFVDGLNAALIASPPLQVVGLIGICIGFVPNDICSIVSGAIQVSVQIGIRILSKTLTDRFLRDSNEKIFAPAGLRARLCRTPAMRALAKVPWVLPPPKPNIFKRMTCKRKAKKSESVEPPMKEKGVDTVAGRTTAMIQLAKIDPSIANSVMRRVKLYEEYIQPLTFEVPPPRPPTSIIVRMSDYSVRMRRQGFVKKAANEAARRQLLAGVPVTRELTWSDRRVMKKLAQGKEEEVKKAVEKGDKREMRDNEKILWLVIVTEEEDRVIQGSERADDSKDVVVFTEAEIAMAQKEYETELIRDEF